MNNSYLAVYARRCEQMGATSGTCTDHLGLLGDAGEKVRCVDYKAALAEHRRPQPSTSRSVAPPSQPGTVKNWIDKVSANQLMVAATLLTVGATIYVSRRNR